jgi:hypothetical protein
MAHLVGPWIVRYVDRSGKQVPKCMPAVSSAKQNTAARQVIGAGRRN